SQGDWAPSVARPTRTPRCPGSASVRRAPSRVQRAISRRFAQKWYGSHRSVFAVSRISDMSDDPHQHPPHEHSELAEMDLRVRALRTVLEQKGYIDPAALDVLIDTYETKIGPRNGARVVARAWIDAVFRNWLLEDATAAIASLGYVGRQGEYMV